MGANANNAQAGPAPGAVRRLYHLLPVITPGSLALPKLVRMKRPATFSFLRPLLAASLVAGLGACAGYAPSADLQGADRARVTRAMGQPTLILPQPAGERLVYARGPQGLHTYFVDLDTQGRVLRWEQRLTDPVFNQITPGMSEREVVALVGPSFEVSHLARQRGKVWAYRYDNPFCLWFQVELAQDGKVRSAGRQLRPDCDGMVSYR